MKESRLFSVVSSEEGDQVFIHLDLDGVDYLINELNQIKIMLNENNCPHTNLFTKEWGGSELSSSKLLAQKDEVNQVNHLKIYGWNDEWKRKHKLL